MFFIYYAPHTIYVYVLDSLLDRAKPIPLDRPSSTNKYIGLADLLENHNTLHHTLLLTMIGNVRYLSLHVLPILREGVPSPLFLDGLVFTIGSVRCRLCFLRYDAFGSDIQPLKNLDQRAMMSPGCIESPLNWLLCLRERKKSLYFSWEQTGQNIYRYNFIHTFPPTLLRYIRVSMWESYSFLGGRGGNIGKTNTYLLPFPPPP